MRLLLLRHGEAAFDAMLDSERNLTDRGRLQLHTMLQNHGDLLEGVETLFHSPYRRTCQTAEIVGQYLSVNREALSGLTPESSPQQLIEWLADRQRDTDVLILVTHQPLVGNLVSLLCEGDYSRPEPMLPGALAVIEMAYPAVGLGQLKRLVL